MVFFVFVLHNNVYKHPNTRKKIVPKVLMQSFCVSLCSRCWCVASDLWGGDRQQAGGLQLVDPSIQDTHPREIYLNQVWCKLGRKRGEKYRVKALSFVPSGNPQQNLITVLHNVPRLSSHLNQSSISLLVHASVTLSWTDYSNTFSPRHPEQYHWIITDAGIKLFSLSSKIQLVCLKIPA